MVSRNELNIIISARDQKMRRVFDRATKRMERLEKDANRNSSRTSRHFDRMGKASKRAGAQISAAFPGASVFAASTAGAVAFGAALTSIVRNGDKLVRLEGRLKAITGSTDQAKSGVEGLSAIMIETGTDIDTASQSFTRFTQAAKAIGGTQKEVLTLTDTLLKMGRIGGGSAQELQSGAIQLAQALASGQLRGDELRSVMENLPVVTEALADALGVGVGKLREMAEAGELTSRKVFDALLSKADETNKKFAKLPITVDMAAGRMSAAWARFAAQIDDSIGLSRTLASVLDGIAAKFERASLTGKDLVEARIQEEQALLTAIGGADSPGSAGPRGSKGDAKDILERIRALKEVRAQYLKSEAAMNSAERARTSAAAASSKNATSGSSKKGEAPLGQRMDDVYGRSIELLIQREELIGKTAAAQARLNAENTLRNRLESEAGDNIDRDGVRQQIEELVVAYGELSEATFRAEEAERKRKQAAVDTQEAAKKALEESQRATDAFVDGLVNSTAQARGFEDALKQIGIQLVKLAASDFLKGLLGGTGGNGIFGKLFSSAGASLLGGFSGGLTGSTTGSNGLPAKFAKGGAFTGSIVNSPTAFSAGGRPALMGEAGPEAIMPLSRGPNGQLGVKASGGAQSVHVTVEAGPQFDVSVQQATAPQVQSAIGQNNKARDDGFRTRFMATNSEIGKDLR